MIPYVARPFESFMTSPNNPTDQLDLIRPRANGPSGGVPAVEMRNVELSLGTGAARVHILRGVSLSIARGETVGLIGPSGSGKSTLLMAMAGLERPDGGEIFIDGEPIHKMGEDK